MRVLVTGAAGFVGSHLCEMLLSRGDEVVGLDSLNSYYNVVQKRGNLNRLLSQHEFEFVEVDLRTAPLEQFTEGVEVVYHQAAQPGVRTSWATFSDYVNQNVLATQRLLEACKTTAVGRFVYASSSSVYGNASTYPTDECTLPQPHSPYGVTKLAAEQLVRLYGENWGLPTVSLRYFTVYGPRQRPDMAMHRIIEAALKGRRFPIYGDGAQVRDFTYVADVARANVLAADAEAVPPGSVFNVAGGTNVSLAEVIKTIEGLTRESVRLARMGDQAGDVRQTGGATERIAQELGWRPQVSLLEGLRAQIDWHRLAGESVTVPVVPETVG